MAIGARARLVKVDDARHVRGRSVVDDLEDAFLTNQRFVVAVGDESAQRCRVADDVDAVDGDLAVDVSAGRLVLKRRAPRATAYVDRDVLDRTSEGDCAAAIDAGGDRGKGDG